ncbi:synaptopodin isoform X2 [Protopterus annectens]|uniref:synaptopodin isoform X2 n=1 Tax=Protopterus annectens TaxID=7888 RepID=UPI001CFAA8F2|nr:synaptopodin isoform X2 [Protopterus annectens]
MLKIVPDSARFQPRPNGPIEMNVHLFSSCFTQTDGNSASGLLKSNLRMEESAGVHSQKKAQEQRETGKGVFPLDKTEALGFQNQQTEVSSESGCQPKKFDQNCTRLSSTGTDPSRKQKELFSSAFQSPESYNGSRPLVSPVYRDCTKQNEVGQDWKTVKVTPVMISHGDPARKPTLLRSVSLSEKELKDAKDRSQKIAAQLTTPPSSSSKGVLLFNKRKQRVNKFTWESYGKGRQGLVEEKSQGPDKNSPKCEKAVNSKYLKSWLSCDDSRVHYTKAGHMSENEMEDYSENITNAENLVEKVEQSGDYDIVNDNQTTEMTAEQSEVSSSSKREGSPLKAELQIDLMAPVTNGHRVSDSSESTLHVSEIQCNLALQSSAAKPASVLNRTAKPFGIQSPTESNISRDQSPVPDVVLPPRCSPVPAFSSPPPPRCSPAPAFSSPTPPRHAPEPTFPSPVPPRHAPEPTFPSPTPPRHAPAPTFSSPTPPRHAPAPTFSSPPTINRVTSPTLFIASYQPSTEPTSTFAQGYNYGLNKPSPIKKTGILDDLKMYKSVKKPMFTFHEKPKLAPNPDLLAMVQNVDEKRKHKEQETPAEEEHLALGAEASNFLHKDASAEENASETAPEWASTLKSSDIRARHNFKQAQGLTDAKGRGAELFAKRQSRMEKYVVEKPSGSSSSVRPPSPTMSLPSVWKYSSPSEASLVSPNRSQTPTYSSGPLKPQTTSSIVNDVESPEKSFTKRHIEIAKHQPYQLNSSLFIYSSAKDPVSSLPKAAPPPKPRVPDPVPFARQSSCPVGYTPPSPASNFPSPFRSPQQTSGPQSQVPINGIGSQSFRSSDWVTARPTNVASPVSPTSSYRISSPKPKEGIQVPRPFFSAKKAGIEPQVRNESLPSSPNLTPNIPRRFSSCDRAPSIERSFGVNEAQPGLQKPVSTGSPSPTSPSWSERSLSPLGQDLELKANKSMQALIARNIINAAKRKSTSPTVSTLNGQRPLFSPTNREFSPTGSQPTIMSPISSRKWINQSPIPVSPPETPIHIMRSPIKPYSTRSLTDSDVSIDSEDSEMRSSGIKGFNICPKGWSGNLRLKKGSIPSEASCTS